MVLKPFHEFMVSLSKDDWYYICGATEDNTDELSVKITDPDAINEVAAFINGQSVNATVRLLEKYHAWISQQLQKSSGN